MDSRFVIIALVLSTSLFMSCKQVKEEPDTSLQEPKRDPYPLDELSRKVPAKGPIKCPKLKLISHLGTHVKYHKPVTVHPAFKQRLIRFEKLVEEVAVEIYGRPPQHIRHLGTYNCRRIGGNREELSEHRLATEDLRDTLPRLYLQVTVSQG